MYKTTSTSGFIYNSLLPVATKKVLEEHKLLHNGLIKWLAIISFRPRAETRLRAAGKVDFMPLVSVVWRL
jgi:hypothetical protein